MFNHLAQDGFVLRSTKKSTGIIPADALYFNPKSIVKHLKYIYNQK
ncbi:hypothetical protein C789_730 [Microcystis aeruginosa FACHB-905 = DIANCHI905]|nr:hypothetical protein C789_730 [Microcystis aeruginosa FACHB-905 = DIANCHI905]